MYIDRLSNDALFTSGTGGLDRAGKDDVDGRAKLEEALREAALARLQLRFHTELMPALRTAARMYLAYVLAGVRAGQVFDELAAAGSKCSVPRILLVDPAGLPEMISALIEGGLIDAHDSLLAQLPATAASKPE